MKIFIDTSKLNEIKKINELGVLDGVTTNPSLIKQAVDDLKSKGENIDLEDYIKEICKASGKNKPVSLEVISTDVASMVSEAKLLHKKFNFANNVVIKIPLTADGLKAINELNKSGIKTNATLIMTVEQALLAAKAGATYVSPFAGRIDDYLRSGTEYKKSDYFPAHGTGKDDNGIVSGVDLVRKITDIFEIFKIDTEIIAASIRNARQVREVALAGAHIATIPFSVINEMLKHSKTDEGIIKFSEDTIPEYRKIFD
ncbi:MAG: transaldolase family protein [Candidatus Aenigmatarchaeota archaeon]